MVDNKAMEKIKQETREEPEQVSRQCCRHFCTNFSQGLLSRLGDRQKKFRQTSKDINSQII